MRRRLISLITLGTFAASTAACADTSAATTAPAMSAAVTPNQIQPTTPPPNFLPPGPTSMNPPVPITQPIEIHHQPAQSGSLATPATTAPSGQWVFTQQYGWLWMPYDQAYTHVEDDAALAYEYVYYPTYGWSWVVAPWVLGFGISPYWGVMGVGPFAWYAHPWFRVGTAHLRPSWGIGAGPRGGFSSRSGRMGGGRGRR